VNFYLGIDIGGTNTVVGIVDETGRVVASRSILTAADSGPSSLFDRIAAAATRDVAPSAGVPPGSVKAIGMGVPGFVDHESGVCVGSVNLKWANVPVVAEMQRRLGVPTFINNDVRMYVYGEAMRGAGKRYRNVMGITVGTGLAAGMVFDGAVFHGAHNLAGELGHIPLAGIPYACGCGLTGCLETVASATGLVRIARELIEGGHASVLREWHPGEGVPGLTAKRISDAYDLGDAVAIETLNRAGAFLGQGLAYAVTLMNPDVLVVGGGAAAAGERLLAPMRESLKGHVIKEYWDRLRIVTAELGDDAGVIGGALYAKRRVSQERSKE